MEFGILGRLEVVADDGTPIEVPNNKMRSLVALLALQANHVVSLDRLIDQLWGDEPPATATGTLQAYVSNLRRLLEPNRRPREPARIIVTEAPGYVLRIGAEQVDAVRFERLVLSGERDLAEARPAEADTALAQALELWRGAPLADLGDEAFIAPEVARLCELRALAWECRIDAWLLLGRQAAAAAELKRLLAEYPLRERLWGLWMIALYRSGRQAEALRAYQECRRVLGEELGLEPGTDLRRLERSILEGEPIAELEPPPAVPTRPVGAALGPRVAVDTEATPSRPAPAPAPALPDGPPLVGRDPQLRRLVQLVEGAAGGRGGVVLVEGEPGIGKTRLLEELSRRAEHQGFVVAWSRCAETAGAPAFWPWTQVLRALGAGPHGGLTLPDGGDVGHGHDDSMASMLGDAARGRGTSGDPAAARFRLYQEVADTLTRAARARPLLIVIDDLHWADVSSRQLLQFVAGAIAEVPVLVVATLRDAGGPEGFEDLLGALARERNSERMQLRGLTVLDVMSYLQVTSSGAEPDTALASALHDRTDGNPFFLIELIRLLTSEKAIDQLGSGDAANLEVPASVRDVIHRRLARLPADTQTVLRVASALGRRFDLDLLAAASGPDTERLLTLLEPALATGFVIESLDSWSCRFSHALLPEALYGSLSGLQRARIHRRVGEALELSLGPGDSPRLDARVEELAHHFFAALPTGTSAKAVDYAVRAARKAERDLAHEEAVRYWEQSLTALDRTAADETEQRYEVLLGLSQARRRIGDVRRARERLEEAIAIARSLGDTDRAARAAVVFGGVTLWNWRAYGESDSQIVALLEILLAGGAHDHPELRAQLLGTLGVELYYTDRRERREACVQEAVDLARAVGDPALLGRVLNNYYIALWTPDREVERRAATEEALRRAGSGLPPETELIARLHRMWSLLRCGEIEAYDAELATCDRLAADIGVPELRGQVLHGKTGQAILRGRWTEAEQLAAKAMERLPPTSVWGAQWCRMVQLFSMRREQGRLDELLPEMLALCDEPGGEPIRPSAVLSLACLGHHEAALARIDGWGTTRPFDWSWDFLTAQWAEVAVLVGSPDPQVLYDALRPRAGQLVVAGTGVTCWGSNHMILGLLARRLGQLVAARDHLVAAIADNGRIGARPFQARAAYHLARLIASEPSLAEGRRPDDLLQQASAIALDVGMDGLVADIVAFPNDTRFA